MSRIVMISTTVDSAEDASALAEALVAERLAACAHILPIHSVYRWDGKVQRDAEHLVQIKTTEACTAAVKACILRLHKYEVPEILVIPVSDGSEAYLGWIKASVQDREET